MSPTPNTSGQRVLVVDDERSILVLMERVLGRSHSVVTVRSASDALALLRSGQQFDLVICDLHMPGMDGREFFKALQVVEPRLADSMVFMSGDSSEDATEFFDRLPNAVVTKPFDLAKFRQTVSTALAAA